MSAMTITIYSKREGFRRCGIAHSTTPVTYTADHFGASELDALRCEPMLIVEEPVVLDNKQPKQSGKDESVDRGTDGALDPAAGQTTSVGVSGDGVGAVAPAPAKPRAPAKPKKATKAK